MNYVRAKLNWEEVFIQEALDLEDKMSSLTGAALSKSRLRLSLEQDILSWKKYQLWISTEINCSVLSEKIENSKLQDMIKRAEKTLATQSHVDFWSEDLIPFGLWDGNLIVLGLEKNERLNEIPKTIFILSPPKILSSIAEKIFKKEEFSMDFGNSSITEDSNVKDIEKESEHDADGSNVSSLDGIDVNAAPPKFSFSSSALVGTAVQADTNSIPVDDDDTSTDTSLWDYITERHDEYSFEVKKQFDAYIVLKNLNNRTSVFKMDQDLENKKFESKVFECDLESENPFHKVMISGNSESFNMNQLGFEVLDFNYACITPLKRGSETVGFLVGLKVKHLAEEDQNLLEDLAKESA